MSEPPWSVWDDGYLNAYQWSRALAGGAELPVEPVELELAEGEVAHARLAPVTLAVYSGERSDAPPTFVVFGGPVMLAASASVAMGREATYARQAQRAAQPHWHAVGTLELVVTDRRLLAVSGGRVGSLALVDAGPVQLSVGLGGGPAVQLQPPGNPAILLESPSAPVLYVFVRELVDGRPPAVSLPAGLLERAKAEGRLS